MITNNYIQKPILNKYLSLILIIIFAIIFFLEFLYFLPSATGDDLWFLKLSFNICRDNLFVATNESVFEINSEAFKWTTHGWFNQYLMGKLNFNCSLEGIFLFNFFVKIFSSILIYLTLNEKKINFIFIFILILLTLTIQLKLQFRPETFVIFLYLLLIYNFFRNHFLIVGILLATIFFTQPTIFALISLFGLIIYSKECINNYLEILIGILISFSLLIYIYPYSFFEYIYGLWEHKNTLESSSTLLNNGINQSYISNLIIYYVKTNFLPLFGFLFLSTYLFLIYKKKLLILTIPFMFYFGPNSPSANYILICLTPLLVILFTYLKDNPIQNIKYSKYLFSLALIVSMLGLGQYFMRNVFTAIQYSGELNKTREFLIKNKDKIYTYPGFSFIIDKDFKFVSLGNKEKKATDFDLKIYAINGNNHICNRETFHNNKPQKITIFSKKIFNSNSGYGIWVCN
tara:strand:- start:287 stop:1663 length:1377 start_codon:yes stop_codon:yes gene_type:complete